MESERIYGSDTEQTPLGLPRAHLRRLDRAGVTDPRAVDFSLRWAIPSGSTPAEQAEFARKYRHQSGYNRLISPWIVAIADPRASEHVQGTATEKANAGCISCVRPPALNDKDEPNDKVYEFLTKGRFIAVRPGNISTTGPYAYLNDQGRMEARVPTTIADTVREKEVAVPAQNPPLAGGMLQERTYVHSGEVEINALDLVLTGRAGVDVPLARTHRSRTIGGNILGLGWEAPYLRRLRSLPNGKVEYRDGIGEVWTFEPEQVNPAAQPTLSSANTIDRLIGTRVRYKSPAGLFLKLARYENGWIMFDQQWRISNYDNLGRLVSESDAFWTPNDTTKGNVFQYAYDSDGRLTSSSPGRSHLESEVLEVHRLEQRHLHDARQPHQPVHLSRPARRGRRLARPESHLRIRQIRAASRRAVAERRTGCRCARQSFVQDKLQHRRQAPAHQVLLPDPGPPHGFRGAAVSRLHRVHAAGWQRGIDTDPKEELDGGANPTARVKWEYFNSGNDRDRVHFQIWPCANATSTTCQEQAAAFGYLQEPLGLKTLYSDILDQDYIYATNRYPDGSHIFTETLLNVDVMKKADNDLPASIGVNEPTDPTSLITTFNEYDLSGLVKQVTDASGLVRIFGIGNAPDGAPGRIVQSITEQGTEPRVTTLHYDSGGTHPNSGRPWWR